MPRLFRFAPIGALLSLLLLAAAHNSSAATFTVRNTNDSGPESLRQLILNANINPGADTINFEIPTNHCIITLASELPAIDGELTIDGSGNCGFFTISGSLSVRVMLVNSGATLQVTNLAITNGHAASGGGISNSGTLTLNNSTVSGNAATLSNGGGINNSGSLTLNNSIVSGNFALSGEGGGVYNGGGTLSLNNSTVSGNSSNRGGGIHTSGTLSMINSAVSDNDALGGGGGISTFFATLTLTDSIVNGNTAQIAGGIYNNGGMATLTNSIVSNNFAPGGGGIYNTGTMTLDYSTASGNSATGGRGGGIYNNGTLALNNSTVSHNAAEFGDGGGIYSTGTSSGSASVTLTNSTLSANSASTGGGIMNFDGPLTLINSTVSGNSANTVGGISSGGITPTLLTLTNSIIANSTAGDCLSNMVNASYSLVENGFGCGVVNGVDGNLTSDPMLGPLQDNGGPTFTHALLPGSPAIDAGDPAYVGPLTTDQRGAGFDRVVNGYIDIGAFEAHILDSDGDGVLDSVDFCPGTVLPEAIPSQLRKNRYYADANGDFVDITGAWSGITVVDTGGCSASQIIDITGVGDAHRRFGITRSVLLDWIATIQ